MVALCTEEKEVTITVSSRKPDKGSSISCGNNSYVFIHNITGLNWRNNSLDLSDIELLKIRHACTCRKHCNVPKMQTNRKRWYIKIHYECIGKDRCQQYDLICTSMCNHSLK